MLQPPGWGRLTSEPVILFATDQRFLWIGYDGTGGYGAPTVVHDGSVGAVQYGRYQLFAAVRNRVGEPFGGFGFLGLSTSNYEKLPPSVQPAAWSMADSPGARAAMEAAFGEMASRMLDHYFVRSEVAETWPWVVIYGFPMWTPLLEQMADFVGQRAAATDDGTL